MEIVISEDLKRLSKSTIFSYREVYALAQFIDLEKIETFLNTIALSGLSMGEFLLSLGISHERVYNLLYSEAEYIQ